MDYKDPNIHLGSDFVIAGAYRYLANTLKALRWGCIRAPGAMRGIIQFKQWLRTIKSKMKKTSTPRR